MFRVVKKTDVRHPLQKRLLSVVIALVVAGLFIGLCGYNPVTVYYQMLKGSLFSKYCIRQTVIQTIPLLVLGLGVAVCFKMKFMNIGAQGQFYVGTTAATWIALNHGSMPLPITLVLMFVAAFIFGGLWCLIAALLKSKWGVNETLVTLMLNYIAVKLVSYLQYSAWKDPNAYGYPKIATYDVGLQLPEVFGVHVGWMIALVLMVLTAILLGRTKLGYEIAVLGENPVTARYAGMNTKKVLLLATMIGGGLCGLAGVIQATGVEHTMNDQMASSIGFTAIVVAYMASMRPVAILVVAFFFSIMLQGGSFMQTAMQIPSAAAEVMQGIILLFVLGSEFFTQYGIVWSRRKEEKV